MVLAVAKALQRGAHERDLRVDRQHVGVGRRLCGGGRDRRDRRPAAGPDRGRQAAPGAGRRRPGRRDRRQLRRRPAHRPRSSPSRPTTRSRSSTRSTPTGSRARRPPRSRSATTSATRPTCSRSRSATPATSAPTGRASASTRAAGHVAETRRACRASRPPAPRRWSTAARSSDPETVATAIRIGNPASWTKAIAARDESGGTIEAVSDEEILAAQRDLARVEGIFCEPASAASVAGVRRLAAEGRLGREETIVCVLTGTGSRIPRRRPPACRRCSSPTRRPTTCVARSAGERASAVMAMKARWPRWTAAA